MMKRENRRLRPFHSFPLGIMAMLMVMALIVAWGNPSASWCDDTYVRKLETPVEESIDIRQKSQADRDDWEAERAHLQVELDKLTAENQALTERVSSLDQQKRVQVDLNQSLRIRDENSRRIAAEITPFLEDILERVASFVSSDTPFLPDERSSRIARLKDVAKDPEISQAEKFRKTMEALFVEAEYGNTVEVYQDKIRLEGEEILGDVFRLGRVSLFFLSLDRNRAAYFQVGEREWCLLEEKWIPGVLAAVEMGEKRRPIELLCLPVGRLGVK